MSQDWVSDLYTTGTIGDITLSNMELMFATLRSSFAGASSPSNAVLGNLWYDSGSHLLKPHRNGIWAGILAGSTSLKKWIYLNAAEDGWAIDSTVVDRILVLKGGSTYTTGGATAGSWTLSGISVANHAHHTHPENHIHYLALYSTTSTEVIKAPFTNIYMVSNLITKSQYEGGAYSSYKIYYYTGNPSPSSTGNESPTLTHSPSHDGTDRPAAAVGTLQYPNVSG